MAHHAFLHSDHKLFNGGPMDELVQLYAMNESLFETELVATMIKLGSLSPLSGEEGQMRLDCFQANWLSMKGFLKGCVVALLHVEDNLCEVSHLEVDE